jgi:hypothetical protein
MSLGVAIHDTNASISSPKLTTFRSIRTIQQIYYTSSFANYARIERVVVELHSSEYGGVYTEFLQFRKLYSLVKCGNFALFDITLGMGAFEFQ